jgi:hypothetical protein
VAQAVDGDWGGVAADHKTVGPAAGQISQAADFESGGHSPLRQAQVEIPTIPALLLIQAKARVRLGQVDQEGLEGGLRVAQIAGG